MHSTRTAGVSSLIVVLIGAAAIGAGALMSNTDTDPIDKMLVTTRTSMTDASSSVAIAVEEESVKRASQTHSKTAAQAGGTSLQVMEAQVVSEDTDFDPAATVTYTDDGFSPQEVTVTAGSAVEFTNDSDDSMWVSATESVDCDKNTGDNFNQCGDGDRFFFKFDTAGKYTYFNHENPDHSGTIIVTEE